MAKQPRTKLSGKEARYVLKQNNISLAWLAEQLGIKAQSLQSRLNATEFKPSYQLEINNILGRRIFDIDMADSLVETKGRIPVIDMRVSAGFGVSLLDGNENRTNEYVTFEGLNGCVGVYVYGDSMLPDYRAGDIVFVRQVLDPNDIDYGRPYVIITKSDRVLIDKWMNPKTGKLADIKEKDYPSFMCGVHYNIKATAKALGITKRISFYTARKSFVQHGFELGIPLETLEYCIGQTMKSNRPIFNYVKIMRQHADLAIRQIIDNLLNSEP